MIQNETRRPTETAHKINRALMYASRVMKSRPFLFVVALLFAIVVWAGQLFADETFRTERVFTNVDITVTNIETLRGRGYTLTTDVSASLPKITMRVSVPWQKYNSVTAATYTPRLDLSKVALVEGEQTLKFDASSSNDYGQVVAFDPPGMTVNVESYTTLTRVPVTVNFTGNNANNLWFSTPVLEPSTISVSGPRSIINQISRAVINLSLEDLSEDRQHDQKTAKIYLVNAKGGSIDSSMLRVTSESVAVTNATAKFDVYPLVELPIDASSMTTGTPAHGYELANVVVAPDKILVAGPRAVINRLSSLQAETAINIQGASESKLGGSRIKMPPELKYASASDVVVRALIKPATLTRTLENLPIEIRNTDPALIASLSSDTMSAIAEGNYLDMEALTGSAVHIYIDASGLSAGSHKLDISIEADNVRNFSATPMQAQVILTLEELEEEVR